ncbi:MAG: protein-(glutamine-N5) methyltransferase, release factor-specific [Methylophaga sp.]|nr:MAG: protein-(glutamine-N5) methyltransferase, release factor-specific [Methylophaga sp.]
MNISQALIYGRNTLIKSESPEIDAQVLLCHILSCQTTFLHSWAEKQLNQQQQDTFKQLIKQRQRGQPIAHITGQQGFWTLDLNVTADTLIPRPDTELLVELALSKLTDKMIVADLGTGSGAIALALAHEQPTAQILAMDQSSSALIVAKKNAVQNQLNNVSFWQGKWLDAITEHALDLVVSNPPYIEEDDPHLLQGDVRFEPLAALTSGDDGLDDIRIIVRQAQHCLKSSGWFLVEHGYDQAQQVLALFRNAGFTNISTHQDFGGNDRVVMGQKTNER